MDHDEEMSEEGFALARYPIRLNLPDSTSDVLDDAREAVRREFRDSVKWKRLRCRNVRRLSETETGTVFVLEVGQAVEFDWTWEGAVAFRPLLPEEYTGHAEPPLDADAGGVEIEDSVVWSGEILEVDEATGRVFVCVSDPQAPPTTGSFFVRPFEFLAFLQAVFNESAFEQIRELLPSRLIATEGGLHPEANHYRAVGLRSLATWWSKAWSVLWGPPGTGKTYTIGQQVAQVLADPTERILVVSTTNRATDAVAVAVGRAAKTYAANELSGGQLLRIGKGASLGRFQAEELTAMLQGTETAFLDEIEQWSARLARAAGSEPKALIRNKVLELRRKMRDAAQRSFLDASVRVVVSTAFRATTFLKSHEVKESIESGHAPFTTIFIDEAGLISRAAAAALSLLASRRVVLVGDPKQLAPISRISRLLPTAQMKWLAQSSLSHLETMSTSESGVHVLQQQRRMHSDVCSVVSAYQYDRLLTTAPEVDQRTSRLPSVLSKQPRTIWYVLDDDRDGLPTIRADRGPGNRSWTRVATTRVLDRLFSDSTLRASSGMFIAPFTAQARHVATYLATNDLPSWTASTVHSQQGSEADIVIFDSVNAGSYSWPYDEWKRMVNVALSRAREAFIVLSSRAEMDEPYLRPLLHHLAPQILRKQGRKLQWQQVPAKVAFSVPACRAVRESSSVGYQISRRREMRPVLSHEQERLCGLELDGKPRLVRGVAGSGKTVVLAHWLMQTVKRLAGMQNVRIWAVFANRSLQTLIGDSIESAWEKETEGKVFPWERVALRHIREVLDVLLPEVGLTSTTFGFNYDDAAAAYLARKPLEEIQPRCDAMFIDEAQDMGPHALKLLAAIVKRVDTDDLNSRSVNIFYDNAQNIYGRGTPTWSELGLDMRGRSSVMKESFRSTQPITEFALNVLYRLQPPESNPDHKELLARGLIERTDPGGSAWWKVRFNQIDGPKPSLRQYASLDQEFAAIAEYCRELIQDEGVQPSDICLVYNGPVIRQRLQTQLAPALAKLGVELSIQTNRPFARASHMLLASTSHSFKGYDSEVVIIPAVDHYTAAGRGVLANNLYVAMTRARSILTVFAERMPGSQARQLYATIEECLDHLHDRPEIDSRISLHDDLADLLAIIGLVHREWLFNLASRFEIRQEPLQTSRGELIAEPLFWFRAGETTYACFGKKEPRERVLQRLEDFGAKLLHVGEEISQH